ncbi:MAG: glutamate racemase [Gammaproteobacteria bacterium 28-57-27]|nr:MAG: glutamate racemase [Gammaproteobacteria bacterium 28-57-27]
MHSSQPKHHPIGIFDSGVGGLSVYQAIRHALPDEDLLYIADSRHAPYGERSTEFIITRAIALTEFLISRGAKAVVVACNTATVIAVNILRQRFEIPIIALEPAIKPAVAHTQSGAVGVLATRRTLESPSVARLCRDYAADARVMLQPCPGFVEHVELGDIDSPATLDLVARHLAPLLQSGVDTLVLGCTHYVYLRTAIQQVAGGNVLVLDSSEAVARQVARRIGTTLPLGAQPRQARETFFTTAQSTHQATHQVSAVMSRLLGREVRVEFAEV